jgi:hypothetical protein
VNHARLQLFHARLGNDESQLAPPVKVYGVDIPEQAYMAALTRAARHLGYNSRELQYKATHVRDLVLEEMSGMSGMNIQDPLRLVQERVHALHELPGAPVLVSLVQRTRLPFSMFPCGLPPHDVRYVRAISLRVHTRAHLVFQVHRGEDHPAGTVVRSIHLDVDLSNERHALASEMPDLLRTVENTVQIVLMGARPWGRYGA